SPSAARTDAPSGDSSADAQNVTANPTVAGTSARRADGSSTLIASGWRGHARFRQLVRRPDSAVATEYPGLSPVIRRAPRQHHGTPSDRQAWPRPAAGTPVR